MNFLNLHMLVTFAGANPNRDDAGSPKSISYGNVTRSRISSQAMTRPKRRTFEAETDGETTYRSTLTADRITDLAIKILSDSGRLPDEASADLLRDQVLKVVMSLTAKDAAAKAKTKGKAGAKKAVSDEAEGDSASTEDQDATPDSKAKPTLVWLAETELLKAAQSAARTIAEGANIDLTPEDFLIPGRTESLSIAAFGRMFAQRPDLSVEAAIQRSHAFTCHGTEHEVDYFTAVDDLRTDSRGAGHLAITELTAGVYYWHANIDTRQLLRTWTAADAADAEARLTHLFEALFLALPSGKQNTTAHHVLPAAVLVVPAKLPASLQTAYETPVTAQPKGGYLKGSIEALLAEHARTVAAMPSRFATARIAGTADFSEFPLAGIERAPSLDDLASWCAQQTLAHARAQQ
jgi:CRISPR system Cascade subunit CasC